MENQIKTVENSHTEAAEHSCGCGSGGCGSHTENGHNAHSNLPIKFQILRPGDKVVEFGSGTGNDCFAVGQIIGEKGKVVGIELSDKDINIAHNFQKQLNINNVEFKVWNKVEVPLPSDYADIIYSTDDFNLYEDKQKIADEMYRVCDHNGLSCVNDYIVFNEVPDGLTKDSAKLAPSIAGAGSPENLISYFKKTGFSNVDIVEINKVQLPEELLNKYLNAAQIEKYKDIESDQGIFKATLIAEKPTECAPETCCCNHDKHA